MSNEINDLQNVEQAANLENHEEVVHEVTEEADGALAQNPEVPEATEEAHEDAGLSQAVQKRLGKLQAKARRELQERDARIQQLEAMIQQNQAPVYAQQTQFPGLDTSYLEPEVPKEHPDYHALKAIKIYEARQRQAAVQQQQYQYQQSMQQAEKDFQESLERGYEKYDDFENVIGTALKLPLNELSQEMGDQIKACPNSEDVIYSLVKKNRNELQRIVRLPAHLQKKAIVEHSATLIAMQKSRFKSNAPQPASPVKSSGGVAPKLSSDPSQWTSEDFKRDYMKKYGVRNGG